MGPIKISAIFMIASELFNIGMHSDVYEQSLYKFGLMIELHTSQQQQQRVWRYVT